MFLEYQGGLDTGLFLSAVVLLTPYPLDCFRSLEKVPKQGISQAVRAVTAVVSTPI